jgi:acyl-CoA synthetase (AMP-forming)/AMP-acid ligase II
MEISRKAAGVIRDSGLKKGDCFALCFSGNRLEDLAFRLGAAMTGTVPVTVNWQADPLDRIGHKIEVTGSRLILTDPGFNRERLNRLQKRFPGIRVFDISGLDEQEPLLDEDLCNDPDLDDDSTRIVIFTSGTTGRPKGVRLTYGNYETNRHTFDSFLQVSGDDRFAVLCVNPLHHGNSTAVTDWAMRRPGSHIHLVERYTTRYWEILAKAASQGYDRLVAPLVSRHFDFLENLVKEGGLTVELDELKAVMARTDFLLGSAPVGPTTIKRLQEYSGRIPHVRFGATETTLQVLGTPLHLSEEDKLRAFERGWSHRWQGEPAPGYYIGRPHPPHSFARLVKSVTPVEEGFMTGCDPGEPGFLVTRGGSHMKGYSSDPDATEKAFTDGWYTGLGDICFYLESAADGEADYYWMSRVSALLIKGGANYAYDQINEELKAFMSSRYGLSPQDFDLAVVGLRIDSEHDDSLCVTVELSSERAKNMEREIRESMVAEARTRVSKGARPDYVRFDKIPRNFKGAALVPELKKEYKRAMRDGNI